MMLKIPNETFLWFTRYHNIYIGYDNSEVVAVFLFFMEQLAKPKCQIYLHHVILVLLMCHVFIFLLGHLHFFEHFIFIFMENLFLDHPITRC